MAPRLRFLMMDYVLFNNTRSIEQINQTTNFLTSTYNKVDTRFLSFFAMQYPYFTIKLIVKVPIG